MLPDGFVHGGEKTCYGIIPCPGIQKMCKGACDPYKNDSCNGIAFKLYHNLTSGIGYAAGGVLYIFLLLINSVPVERRQGFCQRRSLRRLLTIV